MALVPRQEWVVAHDDFGAVLCFTLVVVAHPFEAAAHIFFHAPAVMVTLYESDRSIQSAYEFSNVVWLSKRKITDVVHDGSLGNLRVPSLDHLFIHLVHVFEWTIGVSDDRLVFEMGIRRNVFVVSHWRPHQDLNLDLLFRRELFCPLNYGDFFLLMLLSIRSHMTGTACVAGAVKMSAPIATIVMGGGSKFTK